MKKAVLSAFIFFSSVSALAQVSLTAGSTVTLGGVTVTCGSGQQEKPSCWCKPVGNNNEFLMIAQYSNGTSIDLGKVQYRAACDMQISDNPLCNK